MKKFLFLFILSPYVATGEGALSIFSLKTCLNSGGEISLSEYRAPAIAIRLPPGAVGPGISPESDDNRWGVEGDSIWVKFDKNPLDWGAAKIGIISVGGAEVTLYKWRDYSDVDQLLGQWSSSPVDNRPVTVIVPLKDESCSAISKAVEIIKSVRFINDENLVRVRSPVFENGRWGVIVINELGEKRKLHRGDMVTSNNGVISRIDASGITVRRYDGLKSAWINKRIQASESSSP
jgi:hypothetical protein